MSNRTPSPSPLEEEAEVKMRTESSSTTNIIAVGLLIFVFLVAVFSMKDDSLTMDEVAHLPAGYSYLTQKDMRLNPEHPPLLKDLAALPLLL